MAGNDVLTQRVVDLYGNNPPPQIRQQLQALLGNQPDDPTAALLAAPMAIQRSPAADALLASAAQGSPTAPSIQPGSSPQVQALLGGGAPAADPQAALLSSQPPWQDLRGVSPVAGSPSTTAAQSLSPANLQRLAALNASIPKMSPLSADDAAPLFAKFGQENAARQGQQMDAAEALNGPGALPGRISASDALLGLQPSANTAVGGSWPGQATGPSQLTGPQTQADAASKALMGDVGAVPANMPKGQVIGGEWVPGGVPSRSQQDALLGSAAANQAMVNRGLHPVTTTDYDTTLGPDGMPVPRIAWAPQGVQGVGKRNLVDADALRQQDIQREALTRQAALDSNPELRARNALLADKQAAAQQSVMQDAQFRKLERQGFSPQEALAAQQIKSLLSGSGPGGGSLALDALAPQLAQGQRANRELDIQDRAANNLAQSNAMLRVDQRQKARLDYAGKLAPTLGVEEANKQAYIDMPLSAEERQVTGGIPQIGAGAAAIPDQVAGPGNPNGQSPVNAGVPQIVPSVAKVQSAALRLGNIAPGDADSFVSSVMTHPEFLNDPSMLRALAQMHGINSDKLRDAEFSVNPNAHGLASRIPIVGGGLIQGLDAAAHQFFGNQGGRDQDLRKLKVINQIQDVLGVGSPYKRFTDSHILPGDYAGGSPEHEQTPLSRKGYVVQGGVK